jgi:hypothetical protein
VALRELARVELQRQSADGPIVAPHFGDDQALETNLPCHQPDGADLSIPSGPGRGVQTFGEWRNSCSDTRADRSVVTADDARAVPIGRRPQDGDRHGLRRRPRPPGKAVLDVSMAGRVDVLTSPGYEVGVVIPGPRCR